MPDQSVRRCYSDFVALHNTLLGIFLPCDLPVLPPNPFFRFTRGKDFLKQRYAALSLYVDALGLWPPLSTCPIVHDFLSMQPLDMGEAHYSSLLHMLAASDALTQWLGAQFYRITARCYRLDCTRSEAKLNQQRFQLLGAFARSQADSYDLCGNALAATRCEEVAERCAESARMLKSGTMGSAGAAAEQVAALEKRLYELLARADACLEDSESSRSSARKRTVDVHNDLLAFMREMVERRTQMERAKERGDTEIISVIEALDVVQRDTADFEASWSKRAAAFLAELGNRAADADQLAAVARGDINHAGTKRAGKIAHAQDHEEQQEETDKMFEL